MDCAERAAAHLHRCPFSHVKRTCLVCMSPPVLTQSGHCLLHRACPLFGVKQTSPFAVAIRVKRTSLFASQTSSRSQEINPKGLLRLKDLAVLNRSRYLKFDVYVTKIGS